MDELGGACSSSAALSECQRKRRLTRVVNDLQNLIASAWKREDDLAELEKHMKEALELKNLANKLQQGPRKRSLMDKLIMPLCRTRCGALQGGSGDYRGLHQVRNEVWIIACQAWEEKILAFLARRTDIDERTYLQ